MCNIPAYNIHKDPLHEFHIISPPVTTTKHPRPPSSLNKYTTIAYAAKKGQTFHKHQRNLLWDRQWNQNTCWTSTSALSSCAPRVQFPAAEVGALGWWRDFRDSPALENTIHKKNNLLCIVTF